MSSSHRIDAALPRAKKSRPSINGPIASPSIPTVSPSIHLLHSDLYLDTINRKVLDFDSEKICSVSLSDSNVYGCLVCNKYFRGRSRDSECFAHSINEDHHVFISFDTLRFYVLPENYELDPKATESLRDIQMLVNPTYTMDAVNDLDTVPKVSLDLAGRQYHPGFVGLVNFGANDYSNVIIQSLAHIRLLRDELLANYDRFRSMDLTSVLSLLVRKMWSSHLFKCHVSAHELLEYIASRSEKKFSVQERGQPKDFLIWILNHLNREFSSELHSNTIAKIFQGKLRLESKKETKFWLLPLSLPSATLFRDSMTADIPQIDLDELISAKNVEFLRLPKVLLLSINRIDNERKLAGVSNSDLNPTVVRFNPDKLVVGGKNYRLIGNILYDTETSTDAAKDEIHYKVQLLDESRREWVEMRDLRGRVVERDLLFLGHSCLQVWTTYPPHQRVK